VTSEVEVFLRVIDLADLGDAALDEPVVIVSTFVSGRIALREIYDHHGGELAHTELPA
jgi:hypothetical protein